MKNPARGRVGLSMRLLRDLLWCNLGQCNIQIKVCHRLLLGFTRKSGCFQIQGQTFVDAVAQLGYSLCVYVIDLPVQEVVKRVAHDASQALA